VITAGRISNYERENHIIGKQAEEVESKILTKNKLAGRKVGNKRLRNSSA